MTLATTIQFRLYVAGGTINSSRAIANMNAFCSLMLEGRCEVEIVDVFLEPQRALADGVLMTPMLVRYLPAPIVKVVGTLSDQQALLDALGLEAHAA